MEKIVSRKRRSCLLILVALVVLVSCGLQAAEPSMFASDVSARVATRWFELQLKLVMETPGFAPPVASRALGYSGVALYEAVLGGMPDHNSLVGQLNDLTYLPQPEVGQRYDWAAVANSALATITRSLYLTVSPENWAAIDALEQEFAEQCRIEAGTDVCSRSVAYGQAVARAVFEWSRSDGACSGSSGCSLKPYVSPSGPGLWVPTPPSYLAPLLPYWGLNRPLVLSSGGDYAPPPPIPYSESPSSRFYAQAMEVYTTVKNLTPEQRAIALFWADDALKTFTPPGHSISIATQALKAENASLALAAETYARVGIAVADSFIVCWYTKYTYDVLRPVSYIQSIIDPTWNNGGVTDPVITPAFPEYTSGHSVQSMAVATVLTALFGDGYEFTDNTDLTWGRPARTFGSFFAAAEEAAISRLYAGVHYRAAIEAGTEQGKSIGARVNALAWTKGPQPLEVASPAPSLAVECGAPDFSGNVSLSWSSDSDDSASLLYQWKLDGSDSGWSSWVNATHTAYGGLSRGTYQFCVRAMDAAGNVTSSICCSVTVR